MVDKLDFESQDQAKRLWQKYGLKLILLILIVLIAIIIWQYFDKRMLEKEAAASQLYQNMTVIMQNSGADNASVKTQAKQLIQLYPKSIYADFARLMLAKAAISQNALSKAKSWLTPVAEHSQNANLQIIAKLRMARIEIALGQSQTALELLKTVQSKAYALSVNRISGFAYYTQKDYAQAKLAWQKALQYANKPALAAIKRLLQMEIDSLAALNMAKTPEAPPKNTTQKS